MACLLINSTYSTAFFYLILILNICSYSKFSIILSIFMVAFIAAMV
jgi:hypothetical protein